MASVVCRIITDGITFLLNFFLNYQIKYSKDANSPELMLEASEKVKTAAGESSHFLTLSILISYFALFISFH